MTGGLKPPSQAEEEELQLASRQKAIFVLEEACLEVGKVGKVRLVLWGKKQPQLYVNHTNTFTQLAAPSSFRNLIACTGLSTFELR